MRTVARLIDGALIGRFRMPTFIALVADDDEFALSWTVEVLGAVSFGGATSLVGLAASMPETFPAAFRSAELVSTIAFMSMFLPTRLSGFFDLHAGSSANPVARAAITNFLSANTRLRDLGSKNVKRPAFAGGPTHALACTCTKRSTVEYLGRFHADGHIMLLVVEPAGVPMF